MIRTSLTLCLAMICLTLAAPSPAWADSTPAQINQHLGRGINLGNMLDAPSEGEWGHVIEASYFPTIAEAGFDSVRIPVRWSAHAEDEAPYTIEAEFMDRVQWAVDSALLEGLAVVLNVHHYEEIMQAPGVHTERLEAIWRQVGERFEGYPETLVFEMLNEPMGELDTANWNAMVPGVLAAIRQQHPERVVVIGPGMWNSIGGLAELELPEDDRLIVTVHYYSPFEFTHQGAEWVSHTDADAWLGTTWIGSPEEQAAVRADLDAVTAWAEAHNVPVYLGEFGAYSKADMESRVRWTRYVTEQSVERGFSFAYWEFCAGFGAYDKDSAQWRGPLLDALLGD